MRFGESCDLHYWWYYQSKRINKKDFNSIRTWRYVYYEF